MNTLYYGDCLAIMQEMPIKGIDLIYLDPPYNSKKEYNSIYKDETGRPLPQQIMAFNDQWTLDRKAEEAIRTMPILIRETGLDDEIATFWRIWVNALRKTQPDLLAYLTYMVQRLLVMRTLLSDTGSIYLHCDPTASHYIKVMMDGIFGHKNFRNEIIWHYGQRTSFLPKHFSRKHDTLLFYSKSPKSVLNEISVPWDMDDFLAHRHDVKFDESGKPFVWSDGGSRGKRYKRTVEDVIARGKPIDTVWPIPILNSSSKERLGYATQKPLALLERIIKASSNEGDRVLDPFCGCATTIEAAHKLNREWIGIDIASFAIKKVARARLKDRLGLIEGKDFKIEGIPGTLEDAKDLWGKDKFVFQEWSISQVDGFPTNKKTGDGGIDGRIYFEAPGEKDLQSMVLEVKGGKHVSIKDLRALHSVLERDAAQMAGLIVMEPLGDRQLRNFERLMTEAGDLHVFGRPFPRMQILTVQEILDGVRFDIPYPVDKRSNQGILISTK